MTMIAIINCPDTGPLESLVVMLRSAGYACLYPDKELRSQLRSTGHDYVLEPQDLVERMGYERPFQLTPATPRHMEHCELYVDIKAHKFYPHLCKRWPRLEGRVLWYRINGGRPEHVVNARGDHGDEVNPPCPVLTPNQWYRVTGETEYQGQDQYGHCTINWPTPWRESLRQGRFYTCWPPFYRFGDYYDLQRRSGSNHPAVCLIHNVQGWGYQDLVPNMRALGVRIYGAGSPNGLVQHNQVPILLRSALAMVHLKSSDAPGYAIYECLAAGCPLICTRRLIWRCRMQELLIPNETCLVFDRETHDGLTPADVESCTAEVKQHLDRLTNPDENKRIGMAGHRRLRDIMWSEHKQQDVESLRDFFTHNFPH